MIAYTIHEPVPAAASLRARVDAVRFVKEGIAWWALFFPFLWLIYHRMWLVLVGFLGIAVALQAGLALAGLDAVGGWFAVALGILFAVEANDLRRWTLARRGYRLTGAVTGSDLAECELKAFTAWEMQDGTPAVSAALRPGKTETASNKKSATAPAAGDEDVIGLFPGTEK